MPRTIKQCLKHSLIAMDKGLQLGPPVDMLIDPLQHRVAVVVLAMTGATQTATVIDGAAVRSYTEDALAIPSLEAVHLAYEAPALHDFLERGLHFRGRDVFSTDGHELGRIRDVQLDGSGKVVEYRLAKGLLRRLLGLTKGIPPSQIATAGQQAAVVQPGESAPNHSNDSSG